jgi:hypothetical protein
MLLRAIAAAFSLATSPPPHAPSVAEIARIQEHLDGALTMMAARDLGVLTDAQRTRRSALVRTLRAYRDEKQFPVNRHYVGQRVPYFRDTETGVLCAVGFLLKSTGQIELIEQIVATNNHVRVRDLGEHPAFRRWLDEHGLLLAEAARIQPQYEGPFPSVPPGPAVSRGTLESSALVSTSLAVAGALLPATMQPRVLPFAGLASSLTSVVLGLRGAHHEATGTMAMVNVGVGAVGAIVASRTLTTPARARATQRMSIAPFLSTAAAGFGPPGLAVTWRF